MKLLALVLLAPLLAGCTSLPFQGGELTAREAHDKALPSARAWRGDAVLTGLVGAEIRDRQPAPDASEPGGEPREDGDFRFHVAPDPTPGNGRAPQWFLEYASASSGAALCVAVYANGTLLTREEGCAGDEEDDEERKPALDLARWRVDSPQAASIARTDANFTRSADAADAHVVEVLFRGNLSDERPVEGDPDDPVWVLAAGSEDAPSFAMVFVNARTGAMQPFRFPGLDFGNGSWGGWGAWGGSGNASFGPGFPFGPCGAEPFAGEGNLTLQAREATHAMTVPEGCFELEAEVVWQGGAPTDRIALEVRGPDGQPLFPMDEERGAGRLRTAYVATGPGDYEVVVSLESGAPQGGLPGAPVGVRANYQLVVRAR